MPAKPQSFATTSAFEVLGPIMVGPSSSHTAGALRCAQVAASLLDGRIVRVTFTLWNSFAHTYKGHGTNRALVAGVLGLDTDDERIRDAFTLAEERGLAYEFVIGGDDASIHPNTVDIHLESETGSMADVRGRASAAERCVSAPSTACTSRSRVCTPRSSSRIATPPERSHRLPVRSPRRR